MRNVSSLLLITQNEITLWYGTEFYCGNNSLVLMPYMNIRICLCTLWSRSWSMTVISVVKKCGIVGEEIPLLHLFSDDFVKCHQSHWLNTSEYSFKVRIFVHLLVLHCVFWLSLENFSSFDPQWWNLNRIIYCTCSSSLHNIVKYYCNLK